MTTRRPVSMTAMRLLVFAGLAISCAVGEVPVGPTAAPGANDTAKTPFAKTGSTTPWGRPTNDTAAHYSNYGVDDTRTSYTVSFLVDNDWDASNRFSFQNKIDCVYTTSINGSGVTVLSKEAFTDETDPYRRMPSVNSLDHPSSNPLHGATDDADSSNGGGDHDQGDGRQGRSSRLRNGRRRLILWCQSTPDVNGTYYYSGGSSWGDDRPGDVP